MTEYEVTDLITHAIPEASSIRAEQFRALVTISVRARGEYAVVTCDRTQYGVKNAARDLRNALGLK